MHPYTLLPLIALSTLVNSLPTPQSTALQVAAPDYAGYVLTAASELAVTGRCGPNFGATVRYVTIYGGYRCRFYRYVDLMLLRYDSF